MSKTKLYRRSALERLGSTDRLETLLEIVTPQTRWALLGVGLLVGAIVLWGLYGSVPVRVAGQGILLEAGGVSDVVARSSGQVGRVYVSTGDTVEAGQIIAVIEQPVLLEKRRAAEQALSERKTQHGQLMALGQQELSLRSVTQEKERVRLRQTIASDTERKSFLEVKVGRLQSLLGQGLITPQALEDSREELRAVEEAIQQHRQQLLQIEADSLQGTGALRQDILASDIRVREAERALRQIEDEYRLASEVVASQDGRVVEIVAGEGDHVGPGTPILRLDRGGGRRDVLQAVVYVPAADGKRVGVGMEVQIAPSTVKREEYGFVRGDVTDVSELPATYEGMIRTLRNARLVDELAGAGAPFAIVATLRVDPTTVSGLEWSSSSGPPQHIQGGTPCQAWVVTRRMRPVELILPTLRRHTGL